MAEICRITLPSGAAYDIRDASALREVPVASASQVGGVIIDPNMTGLVIWVSPIDGRPLLTFNTANPDDVKYASSPLKPIAPSQEHSAVFYGLAKAAGDTSQGTSSNPVGTYTADAKAAIRAMLGISPGGLPAVTAADNGKILRVVDGAWAASELAPASGVSF